MYNTNLNANKFTFSHFSELRLSNNTPNNNCFDKFYLHSRANSINDLANKYSMP